MKQTAVEWLINQVNTAKWKFADKTDREAIIKQAKEMEREQIKDAFEHVDFNLDDGLHYYNETYNK
jgi:hypothetical protein